MDLIKHKTTFLQSIATAARLSSEYLVLDVSPMQAHRVSMKLIERYSIRFDTAARQHRLSLRKKGLCSYQLFAYAPDSNRVLLVVMRSPGKPPVDDNENWCCVTESHMTLLGYELVRLTRPEASAPAWTWRLSAQRKAGFLSEAKRHINNKDDVNLVKHMKEVFRTIGFAGARADVKELDKSVRWHWQRVMPDSKKLPTDYPKHHGYVRRKAVVTYPLRQLLVRAAPSQASLKSRKRKA